MTAGGEDTETPSESQYAPYRHQPTADPAPSSSSCTSSTDSAVDNLAGGMSQLSVDTHGTSASVSAARRPPTAGNWQLSTPERRKAARKEYSRLQYFAQNPPPPLPVAGYHTGTAASVTPTPYPPSTTAYGQNGNSAPPTGHSSAGMPVPTTAPPPTSTAGPYTSPPEPPVTHAAEPLPSAPAADTTQNQEAPPVVSYGPEGCNLFVFYLPNDLSNMGLYNLFSPFGRVVSVRIVVDKETGRSRGYGFVSFDKPESAQAAIDARNGYKIGHKILKVVHKRGKAQSSQRPPQSPHDGQHAHPYSDEDAGLPPPSPHPSSYTYNHHPYPPSLPHTPRTQPPPSPYYPPPPSPIYPPPYTNYAYTAPPPRTPVPPAMVPQSLVTHPTPPPYYPYGYFNGAAPDVSRQAQEGDGAVKPYMPPQQSEPFSTGQYPPWTPSYSPNAPYPPQNYPYSSPYYQYPYYTPQYPPYQCYNQQQQQQQQPNSIQAGVNAAGGGAGVGRPRDEYDIATSVPQTPQSQPQSRSPYPFNTQQQPMYGPQSPYPPVAPRRYSYREQQQQGKGSGPLRYPYPHHQQSVAVENGNYSSRDSSDSFIEQQRSSNMTKEE